MAGRLLVEDVAPGVRALTLSNPDKRNALDPGLLDALDAALGDAKGVRAWLLRSDDARAFSAGYDLSHLNGFPPGTPLPDERLGVVLDRLSHHPAPSVALVRGAAIGAGCELAIACDFRVGDATARFGFPPAKLGVVYALKGLARVRSRVGPQVARQLFLLARTLEASEALSVGLLDVLEADPAARALELCTTLAAHSSLAVGGMKRGLALLDAGVFADEAYEALRRQSFNGPDAQEGRAAMLERRAPMFD
ncbi:MAG: enoyl-CoA hydratase-related protein [Myxococcaceae bacterium]